MLGVDNDRIICRLCRPTLSSIEPDVEKIGFLAAQWIADQLEGNRHIQKRLTSTGEKRIYWKHATFAERAVYDCIKNGSKFMGFNLPPFVEAYLRLYPKAKSRARARASMSRLMRRRDVRAAVQWYYAEMTGEVPRFTAMPETPSGIKAIMEQAGCWRAPYIPVHPRFIVEIVDGCGIGGREFSDRYARARAA